MELNVYLRLRRSGSYRSGSSCPMDLYTITTATGKGAAGSAWRRFLLAAVGSSPSGASVWASEGGDGSSKEREVVTPYAAFCSLNVLKHFKISNHHNICK